MYINVKIIKAEIIPGMEGGIKESSKGKEFNCYI
jgi:hypothetical protein